MNGQCAYGIVRAVIAAGFVDGEHLENSNAVAVAPIHHLADAVGIAGAQIVPGADGTHRLENSSQAFFHKGLHRLTSLFIEDGFQRQVRIQMMRLQP